jgi:hypothetical protein
MVNTFLRLSQMLYSYSFINLLFKLQYNLQALILSFCDRKIKIVEIVFYLLNLQQDTWMVSLQLLPIHLCHVHKECQIKM